MLYIKQKVVLNFKIWIFVYYFSLLKKIIPLPMIIYLLENSINHVVLFDFQKISNSNTSLKQNDEL